MPLCRHMLWIVFYGSTAIQFPAVAADCYFPNGLLNELYQPCNRNNEHSMCCGTRGLDRCRNDGLCFDAPNNDMWRGSCTDPTWRSPACIKLCVEGTDQDGNPRAANGQRVSQCRDGSFCCGKGSDASRCCNRRRGVFIANGTIIASNPSSSAPESKSSVTSSWSPPTSLSLPSVTTISQGDPSSRVDSPSPPSTSASSQSPRPNHLVPIIAGVLGGVIGLFVLIGTILWLFRRKRKGVEQSSSIEDSIVILDTAQTMPTRQESRRGKHPQPIRHMRRINGTVRPPEFQGMAENEVWDRVIFVDQLGGAVRQMGF